MGDYLNSNLFVLEMTFFNLNQQSGGGVHISRKKSVYEPGVIPGMMSGKTINLRQTIENAVKITSCKKLDILEKQYRHLEKVDMYFQNLEVAGPSYLQHLHWSVFEGLSVCEVDLDKAYVSDRAVYYSFDSIDSYASSTSRKMIEGGLSSFKDEYTEGRRVVMLAEDYPAEETQARYNAYWEQAKQDWHAQFDAHFVPFDAENFKKKTFVLAMHYLPYDGKKANIESRLEEKGAIVKANIGKNINYLAVDTDRVERLDCFAERLWKLREGDEAGTLKIGHPLIERAIASNREGKSNIRIVRLQDVLNALGINSDKAPESTPDEHDDGVVSVKEASGKKELIINGQWQFTLPDGMEYEISGTDEKPLLIREIQSVYSQPVCATVEGLASTDGEFTSINGCKNDKRFEQSNSGNSRKIALDDPDFYVDLIAVSNLPVSMDLAIRIRGVDTKPFDIKASVSPDSQEHWVHFTNYLKEIAWSVRRAEKSSPKEETASLESSCASDISNQNFYSQKQKVD